MSFRSIIKPEKTKRKIPKIIHQIWIGTRPVPYEWTDTWKQFCKKHKWVHMLWTNEEVEKFKLVNQKCFDKAKSYQQKSDILRYEIMYKYGGIYLDADMLWLGKNISEYLPLDKGDFIGVQEPYSDYYPTIGRPYLANGFFCCIPKHIILKNCIDSLPKRIGLSNKAFITTGPGLFNESAKNYPITVIPEDWVFPVNFKNVISGDPELYRSKTLIFTKSGFEIPGKITIADWPNILKNYLTRLLYV
jgi:mannosyltransferase OCH1-like enzyme